MTTRTTIAGVAIFCCIAGAAHAQSAQKPQRASRAEQTTVKESAEDVETLRVLLTQELNARLGTARMANGRTNWARDPLSGLFRPADGAEAKAKDDAESAGAESAEDSDTKGAENSPAALPSVSIPEGRYLVYPSLYNSLGVVNGSNATSYTRSFYAPGVGGWIDSSVSIPVKYVSVKTKSADDKGETQDAWDRAKESLTGDKLTTNALAPRAVMEVRAELDKDAVEKAIDAAVTVLAKYGSRVRNLVDDEGVVIALKLEAGSGTDGVFWRGAAGANGDPKAQGFGLLGSANPYVLQESFNVGSASLPRNETVIIRAPRALLESMKNGDVDRDGFKKGLTITRY